MKKLTTAAAGTALAAGIMLAGGASMATADAPTPTDAQSAGSANSVLTQAITLKPLGGAPIYDQLGGMTVLGMGVLTQAEPMATAPFPASAPIQGSDGQFYRTVGIERCGLSASAYFISEDAVATSEPRTARTDTAYTAEAAEIADRAGTYLKQFTGTGSLPDGSLVPMTEPKPMWDIGYVRYELIHGKPMWFTPVAEVADYTPNTCLPNAALPFAAEASSQTPTNTPALWSDLDDAQGTAPNSDSPAWSELDVAQGTAPDISTTAVEVVEQGGMGPAGIWLIAGAGVTAAAGAAGLATSGIKGKKNNEVVIK